MAKYTYYSFIELVLLVIVNKTVTIIFSFQFIQMFFFIYCLFSNKVLHYL